MESPTSFIRKSVDGGISGEIVYEIDPGWKPKKGGFGWVYRAFRRPPILPTDGDSSMVALKVFKEDGQSVESETRGIQNILAHLKKIPGGIAKPLATEPFSVVADDGKPAEYRAIDLEWIPHPTLETLLNDPDSAGMLKENALIIGERILDLYCGLHSSRIVHGDAHIGNLAYDLDNNAVWLLDFSLTRQIEREEGVTISVTRGGGIPGRSQDPLYNQLSPFSSELYALGNVVDSLLTSDLNPGPRSNLEKNIRDTPEKHKRRLLDHGVPEAIADWIVQMTSVEYSQLRRPDSIAAARDLFRSAREKMIEDQARKKFEEQLRQKTANASTSETPVPKTPLQAFLQRIGKKDDSKSVQVSKDYGGQPSQRINMETGTVKWFDDSKAYGFIVPDGPGQDLFVHHSNIAMDGFKTLRDGQRVEYVHSQGRRGPEATNVRPL